MVASCGQRPGMRTSLVKTINTVHATRACWPAVMALASIPPARMAHLHQNNSKNALTTTAFVRPLQDWASPLMAPAASQETKSLFRAISHASTTWWCYGRFWSQQVDNHPAFGVAIRGLCNAPAFLNAPSSQLTSALNRHAEVLSLKITRVTSQALWVQTKRCRAALGIPLRDSDSFFEESLEINTQNTDQDSSIRHALRLRARLILLHQVSRNRFDSEGIENIDLQCTSRQAWSKWVKSLCPADTTALCVWKSGAIWTPTRRSIAPGPRSLSGLYALGANIPKQALAISSLSVSILRKHVRPYRLSTTFMLRGGAPSPAAPPSQDGSLTRRHAQRLSESSVRSPLENLALQFSVPPRP